MMTDKLDGLSMDIERQNLDKLKEVFPDCFSEGKLDINKLLGLCGEYIDDDYEKYNFTWKGKADCLKLAQKRSTGTLRPCREESVDFDHTKNLYIEGDNLEVLKLLQTAYYNSVKMIYIDPPYNTGNDFVYNDDFADPIRKYKEVTGQTTKSNPEIMGSYHTNWLNMMYPRLRLAANLLKEDGVCFISIDDNEVDNLKKICNEVFGEENFIADFIWRKKSTSTNVSNALVSSLVDHILCYSKTDSPCLNRRKTSVESRSYPFSDAEGCFRTTIIEKKDAGEYARATMKYPIMGVFPREGKRWQIGEKTAREYEKRNRFIMDNGIVKLKIYDFEDSDTFSANPNLLLDYGSTDSANKFVNVEILGNAEVFPNPKPIELLKHLIGLGTSPNDIVMDFFSGSATTAHAVMQLNAEDGGNRRFIMVQLPELCGEKTEAYKAGYANICEIGKERIRRAGQKILDQWEQEHKNDSDKPDVGFKVFKLDTSNLATWDNTPIPEEQLELFYERMNQMIDDIKPDRTDMDVVYEVMLKLGVPLDIPVTYMEVNGKIVYVVDDCLLLICLAGNITAEDIEAMAEYAPAKIICAEASFADDSALSNAHYILRDRSIELKLV